MAEPDPARDAPQRPDAPAATAAVASGVDDRTADARAGQERAADERDAAARTYDDDARAAGSEQRDASRATQETRPVARPAEPQTVLEPAEQDAPEAPKRHGNRLAGTAWALLAAGLFQVVYFGLLAALVALLAGPQIVPVQLPTYFTTPLAWLPVLFFLLLFELTVLVFDRAGRFFYVVASLVVGVLVYVLSVVLITILLRGDIGDTATLQQALLRPEFVLSGLAAREVMLWTGVAIGARGTRLRKRNRAERDAYRAELAER